MDQYRHLNEACILHSAEWRGPPKQMLGPPTVDDAKLLWLPEPRRASSWLRMYFVACNGAFIRFEDFYESYCGWFELIITEKSPKTPAIPVESLTSEGQQQVEQERQPQDQRLEDDDTPEQQASEEHPQKAEAEQRLTPSAAAPFPTRTEFLRTMANAFHGVRFYDPSGRVGPWSSNNDQCNACSKYLVSDICFRKEPLTFASTNRERNVRRFEKYKEKGDIVYPEYDPAKLNTFARKLAEDPLFMLPKGTKSSWREREMKRMEVRTRNKAAEESAFPEVSLKKKVFSVPKVVRKPRVGPRTRDTGLSRTSKMPRPARKPTSDADERMVIEEGNGKQTKDNLEPQMVDPANITKLTDDPTDAISPTTLRRKSAPANSVDIPSSSSGQSGASDIGDTGLGTVAMNVDSVPVFEELMRRPGASVIATNSAAVPEELVGEFEKLGIMADFPQWKKGKKQ